MPDSDARDPYAQAAQAYIGDGLSPLPLKPGTKRPRLAGYHGWEGKWVDAVVARKWAGKYGKLDVAIRLPKWIICFDVDDYEGKAGGKTLRALERELGPLPQTIRSTARWGEGVSGIKWFRVPEKYQDSHWAGVAGPGIEIVSWFDRVAVVWPSMHRNGKQYRWYDEGEDHEVEWPEWDIPELPVAWCERFTGESARGAVVKIRNVPAWLMKNTDNGPPCVQMKLTNNLWCDRIAEADGAGGVHDAALKGVRAILGDCSNGHAGAWDALASLRKDFLDAISGRDRARRLSAVNEWRDMVKGAVALVAGHMKPLEESCSADETLDDDDDPSQSGKDAKLLANIKNGSWLNAQTFAPLEFAIPELVPEGLSVLAGPPKAGKSVIMLQFGLEAALGGEIFGMEVGRHRVLYLALEDGHRRMQQRCRELMNGDDIPDWFDYIIEVDPGKLIATVRAYIKEYKKHKPLVMVDTLGKVLTGSKNGESDYDRDYRVVSDLKRQADDYQGSSVLASRHTKKGKSEDWVDMISGTNAITGAADTILALKRTRGTHEGTLHVTGRDLDDNEYALSIDRPRGWALDGGDLLEAAGNAVKSKSALGAASLAVMEFVDDHPFGVNARQVSDECGMTPKEANTQLTNLYNSGRINRISKGLYGPYQKQRVSKDEDD